MITTRGASDSPPIEFTFPFPPQQIQYTNVAPEMSEINRPGRTPLIAFTRYRAKQVSFKFLLAIPFDGLFSTVDAYMQGLQEIANTGRPVYFTNLDRQISNPLSAGNDSNIFWTITDMQFASIRRNERNEVVAAEVSITLVENNNPIIASADLPKLTYTDATPTNNPKPPGEKKGGLTEPTWSDTETGAVGGIT
jgi:hypothetical protein